MVRSHFFRTDNIQEAESRSPILTLLVKPASFAFSRAAFRAGGSASMSTLENGIKLIQRGPMLCASLVVWVMGMGGEQGRTISLLCLLLIKSTTTFNADKAIAAAGVIVGFDFPCFSVSL